MSKISKTSTKEEILKALDEAIEEQNLLHKESETLQTQVDKMTAQEEVKNATIMDLNSKVVDFERQILEEDVKKKGLISQLASQTTDIELAKKKTEKYGEIKSMLESTRKELQQKDKLIKDLGIQLTELEEELTKPQRKAKFHWGFFKTTAVLTTITAVITMSYFMIFGDDTKIPAMSFIKYDNKIISAAHDPNVLTLRSKDGRDLEISGVDVSVAKWAKEAGFDAVLYGKVFSFDNKIMITGSGDYNNFPVHVDKIATKFQELNCYNILALVTNPDNIILPAPFKATSKGDLKFFEDRRKLAGFVPVFWGKNKRVLYISSDNVHGFISSTGIFMKVNDDKISVTFEKPEEVNSSTNTNEVSGIDFSKANEFKENMQKMLE